jgi:hypothetical protein
MIQGCGRNFRRLANLHRQWGVSSSVMHVLDTHFVKRRFRVISRCKHYSPGEAFAVSGNPVPVRRLKSFEMNPNLALGTVARKLGYHLNRSL